MKEQTIPKHRRRKGKKVESNIDLAVHSQTLKQQRQLNDRNHHITINTNTDCKWTLKRHCLTNWIKKEE
jgi:hypothetical protein